MPSLQMKALQLGAKELLSREQLRGVLGGTSSVSSSIGGSGSCGCCVHTSTWNGYICALTKAQALNLFDAGTGGWDNWCCDSCQCP